jgi:transaldolase
MEIWLDSIHLETVTRAKSTGLLTGVTTNPSLVSAATSPLETLLNQLLELQSGPVAIQLMEESAPAMVKEAQSYFKKDARLLVKIPAHEEGWKCMQRLHQLHIPFLATAVFTPLQAVMALQLGAAYVALYVGRIQDGGNDPWAFLETILKAKSTYAYPGKIMAAGLRTLADAEKSLAVGVSAVTLRAPLFNELMQEHPGVTHALKTFKADWEKYVR